MNIFGGRFPDNPTIAVRVPIPVTRNAGFVAPPTSRGGGGFVYNRWAGRSAENNRVKELRKSGGIPQTLLDATPQIQDPCHEPSEARH